MIRMNTDFVSLLYHSTLISNILVKYDNNLHVKTIHSSLTVAVPVRSNYSEPTDVKYCNAQWVIHWHLLQYGNKAKKIYELSAVNVR